MAQKTVFWFDDGKGPNVTDTLAQEKDILVHKLAYNGPLFHAVNRFARLALNQGKGEHEVTL